MPQLRLLASLPVGKKLLLLGILVFLSAGVVIVRLGLQKGTDSIEKAKRDTSLLVESLAAQQEQVAIGTEYLLSTLSRFPAVQTLDFEACSEVFLEIKNQHPFYSVITAVRRDGIMFAASSSFEQGKVDLSDRKHVKDVERTRDFSVGEFMVGRVSNVQSINFAYPVLDSNKHHIATLTAGFRLDQYAGFIPRLNLPEGSAVIITDHKGVRLFRSPYNKEIEAGKPISRDLFQLITGASEQGVIERTGEDGVNRIYAFKQLRLRPGAATYLYILVGISKERITHQANIEILGSLLILGIVGIAMSLTWVFGNLMIARPIKHLVTAAHRIGEGQMGTRTNLPHAADEIGQLAKSFDDMAALLDERNRERKNAEEALRKAHNELEHKVIERTKELRRTYTEMEQLLASIPSFLIGLTPDNRIMRWNRAAEKTFDIPESSALGTTIVDCGIEWDREKVAETIALCQSQDAAAKLEDFRFQRPGGKEGFLNLTINSVPNVEGAPSHILMLGDDTTHRKILESQLVQAQKLESIGQLAAGIAHEINTPTQYVGDNTRFLEEAFGNLERVQKLHDQLLETVRTGKSTEDLIPMIEQSEEDADLEYIRREIPKAIQQALDGIERISNIVRAMKEFSHPGTDSKTNIDMNKSIESTITVARNEWKYVADVVTKFDPKLPLVACLPGEINQVVLNMIINASHAIAEAQKENGSDEKGTITVSTRARKGAAEIRISDTGIGIREEIRSRIFDPFFTTKEVGKGTGQGLAISHSVIVDKHGGTIRVESEPGKGAAFIISLPLQ